MRYLILLLLVFCLFSCDEPVPVSGDEPRNPLIDSAEKCNILFHEAMKGNTFTASVYADLGLEYSIEANYDKGIADGWANKGHALCARQDYSNALPCLKTAIDLYSSFYDSSGIANCSYDLCKVYIAAKVYDTAMVYGQRALKFHTAEKMQNQIYYDLKCIGEIYTETQKFDSAVSVFSQRVSFQRHDGDSLSTADALSDLAGAYVASGDAGTGILYRQMALEKLSSPGIDSSSIQILLFKARLLNKLAGDYFLENDGGKAIKTGQEALAIATRINWRNDKRAALKTLAELYGLAGREDMQLQLMEQYILLNDSLQNEETQLRVAAEKMRCEFISREKELAGQNVIALNEQLSNEKQEGSRRIMLMWILIAALLAVAVGAVMYARKRTNG